MYIEQFYIPKIAHSSYLLAGEENCAIIDPSRDVDIYIETAKRMGLKITHILETHLHADFISGHLDLAEKTGAKIYVPASSNCKFECQPLSEGEEIEIEHIKIKILDTPGHTPEHISYVVVDRSRGLEPVVLFSGDALFVGDVGRPDLFPGIAQELASKLFYSLKKLKDLPDFCEVLPAHGAGSLCGRGMSAKRTSTIGYEKRYNQAFRIEKEEEFIYSLTHDMPPAPDHFARCSDINRQGPQLLKNMGNIQPLSAQDFSKKLESEDYIALDCRDNNSFSGQHISNAYSINYNGNFPTFAGWIIPPDKKILLVIPERVPIQQVAIWLYRIGLDNIYGYLDGGIFEWEKAGLPGRHVCQISANELSALIKKDESVHILDVRSQAEFNNNHIPGALNIPIPALRKRFKELDFEKKYHVLCGNGYHSMLAISLLLQRGFENLINVSGGMAALKEFANKCGTKTNN